LNLVFETTMRRLWLFGCCFHLWRCCWFWGLLGWLLLMGMGLGMGLLLRMWWVVLRVLTWLPLRTMMVVLPLQRPWWWWWGASSMICFVRWWACLDACYQLQAGHSRVVLRQWMSWALDEWRRVLFLRRCCYLE